ncbi:sugar ABC transporter substrate-binding protein [Curtobacterium ammoniigenes]|uniref:sugar ABC transporter substrate-binding protein n=1 Tax=Curtobacterium ammoniigenes TaxID=395387 RepID=UPI00082F50AF|nr:substrate-binding domain-containing protein [Curtobacterium ammoniigenes]
MKIATLKRATVAAAAVLITATALAGCSNGSGSATSSKSGSSSDASKAKIGLLLPDAVTARYESADKPFFEAKVKSLCPNCTVLYANATGDASKQQQQAESMLTQGVSVLVLDAFDGQAAASIVSEAKAKNVPVIDYDRLVNSPDSAYYVSFDNQKVGQLQATALVDHLKNDLKVPAGSGILQVDGSPTDNNATQFKAGADSVLKTSGYKILAEYQVPGWDPTQAQNWVAGQITKFGSQIKAIYDANDGTAGGAIAAEEAAGFGPVPITGQDAELTGIQNILAGKQYMTVYKAIKPEADQAATLAIDLAKGKKDTAPTTVKTAGGASVPSFLLQPVAVTANNIESTVVKDQFYGANSAAQICTANFAAACAKYGIK